MTALLPACGSTLYRWGPYEDSVWATLNDHRDSDIAADLERLASFEADLRERDATPPPGLHAQLGYLYSLVGDNDAARRHLEAEKSWYPEATVFVDGLLERLG